MRIFLAFCIFMVPGLALFAQIPVAGAVHGTVIDDSTRLPLEFVNILLQAREDSSAIAGTTSDKSGTFSLEDVPMGRFFVRFSLVGYAEKRSKTFLVDPAHTRLSLGTVADVFRTQKRELDLETPALRRIAIGTRDAGILYVGVTYHFDTPPEKENDEQIRYEDPGM